VKVDLPAGTYLLTGSGVVNRLDNNVGSGLLGTCRLTGGGAQLPGPTFVGPTALPVSTARVDLSGRVNLAVAGTASIECEHNDFASTRVQGVGFQLLAQAVTVQDNG